jgi:hypothetical protein
MVPLTPDSYDPTNSVVDAVWNLEERIRFLRGLDEAKKNSKQLRALGRRKREGDDTPEEDSPTVSQPRRAGWNRHQHELFNTEQLSGLRSAELSRQLQNTTDQPSLQKRADVGNPPYVSYQNMTSDQRLAAKSRTDARSTSN